MVVVSPALWCGRLVVFTYLCSGAVTGFGECFLAHVGYPVVV